MKDADQNIDKDGKMTRQSFMPTVEDSRKNPTGFGWGKAFVIQKPSLR